MDDADLAQAHADRYLAAAIAKRRTAVAGTSVIEPLECVACGAEIPIARQRAVNGTDRCVPCQEELERRQRR